ncbi:hypothetical protein IT413_01310 [Candidatus Peregrinibacteria bacterium]|nr:hypothetical protein [Candidatus Peregrinibacteria bacterium]
MSEFDRSNPAPDESEQQIVTPEVPPVEPKEIVADRGQSPQFATTMADYYPLVQMNRLADAIYNSGDEKVRRMHGVLLRTFDAARMDFLTFLRALDVEEGFTPTAVYHVDGNGGVLPLADFVTMVDDDPTDKDQFVGLTITQDADLSPIFALTRLKPGPTPPANYAEIPDPDGLLAQFRELAEIAGLDELGTGDEITARRLPPVVMYDELPDLTDDAVLLSPTPSPGIVVDWDIPSPSPSIVVEFGYTPVSGSVGLPDAQDLQIVIEESLFTTPTPRREPPAWVWGLFSAAKGRGMPVQISLEQLNRIEEEGKEDLPKSAE